MSAAVPASSEARFLAGGGEMGERMRALDWSATPLGPIDRWPQSLRSPLSMLLPSKAQIILFWGPQFVVFYNDAYRPVFGAKHPGVLGQPGQVAWREIWDCGAQLHALLEGVVRTGEAFQARDLLFVIERHGFVEETYFDVSYDPVRDESGSVGGVFCIVTETTGRVVGERRLALLRDLAAHNGSGRTARAACALAMQALADRPDVPFALAYLGDELQACTPGAESPSAQGRAMELPLPGGRLVVGLNARRPFDDAYASFLNLVAGQVGSAITNARAYEEERRRAEALAELDRAKTSFFTNVSHEFRTPLTLMLGPLEELHRALDRGPLRDMAATAERNALRLLKLVNTLLDFARIEGGRADARFEPTDLGAATADVASAFRSACERAGLALVVDCAADLPPVYVDRSHWEKIVLNLLSNAFKFTFEGRIVVALRASSDGRCAELSVRDTGVGIPASERGKLFGRFQRIEGVRGRSIEGSGIGLALVAELVKLHRGRIEARSREGQGSVFTVSLPFGSAHLPARQVAHDAPAAGAGPAQAAVFVGEALQWLPRETVAEADSEDSDWGSLAKPVRAHHRAPRLLVADDNADLRAYLRHLLEPEYVVEEAADGLAALEQALADPPDLIVGDVMMPRLDGFALVARLRAQPRTQMLPVILLSARAGEEARIEGLAAGADDYLTKPFSARELRARVAAQLATARIRTDAQASLRASEQKYRSVFNSIDEGFAIVEMIFDDQGAAADYRYLETNAVFERQTGLADAVGRTALELVPDLERKWIDIYHRIAVSGEAARFEEESVVMNRWFDVYASRVGGPGSRLVALVVRDITERKRREWATALLDRIGADLARFTAPDDIMLAVGTHLGETMSLSACVFVDVDETQDWVTVHHGWAAPDVPSLKQSYRLSDYLSDAFARAGRAGEAFIVTDTATDPRTDAQAYARLSIRAFVTIPFHWRGRWTACIAVTSVAPRVWRDDEVELLREVSNRLFPRIGRARADEAMRASQAELREADRRKDEFLATLAHELRNPLAPIRNAIHLLGMAGGTAQTERVQHMLERQVGHLVRLVDDLMEASRISRGKLELKRETVDLADVLRTAIETSKPLIDRSRHQLSVQLPDQPMRVHGDAVRLAQVFANLLNNAAKYTEEAGRIELSARRDGDWLEVRVRDNGIGIAAEQVPRLFEMFGQLDRSHSRTQGGLGIGLALAQRLVQMHGGEVQVFSEGLGRGSLFTVRLPHSRAEGVTLQEPAITSSLHARRVLVVDDNSDAADSLGMLLRFLGAEVLIEHDGPAALATAARWLPAVVLLDLGMPGMDGFEVARRLRADPCFEGVKLIALTGWGQEEDRRRTAAEGFDHHLIKPVDINVLQTLLASMQDVRTRGPAPPP